MSRPVPVEGKVYRNLYDRCPQCHVKVKSKNVKVMGWPSVHPEEMAVTCLNCTKFFYAQRRAVER